ncbi:uncharacterized protein PAF06_009686 [Gastrophryne carolinensis]
MDLAQVKWSINEYTLQKYVSKFSSSFPSIIKITEGFLGKQEIDSVSSGTVIRVHSLYSQSRVIAENIGGKLFSLPAKLTSFTFLLATDNGPAACPNKQVPTTLQDILANYSLPVTVRTSKALQYKQKGDKQSQDERLCELTLQDTYEEIFLLGHPIDKGKIFTKEPIIIPMYMKELKLVVATGFLNGNTSQWNITCDLLTKQVKNQGDIANTTVDEVYLLDRKDLKPQEHNYSTIEPIYLDINEINVDSNKPKQQIGKGSYNVYQYQIISELKDLQLKQAENTDPPADKSYNAAKTDPPADKSYNAAKTDPPADKSCNAAKTDPPADKSCNAAKTDPPADISFKSLNEVPSDLHNLSVTQICECLNLLNMGQYIKAFESSQVDGQLVYDLNQEMMNTCLGMNVLNSIKFLKFRDGWRPNLQG